MSPNTLISHRGELREDTRTFYRVLGAQAALFLLVLAYFKSIILSNGRVPVRKGVATYLECGTTYLRK